MLEEASTFTTELNFGMEEKVIPTYRIMDEEGAILDPKQLPEVGFWRGIYYFITLVGDSISQAVSILKGAIMKVSSFLGFFIEYHDRIEAIFHIIKCS